MIVLDASALVDVVALRPRCEAVLDHLDADGDLAAPGHQLAEVASAIVRLQRADELTAATAADALQDAASLEQRVVPIDEGLLVRAHTLRESIRVGDGLYVALAERLGCALLTTDGRLARADPPCEVILAGDSR